MSCSPFDRGLVPQVDHVADPAERRAVTAATGVGLITLGLGAALAVAPRAAGGTLGVPGDADVGLRVVGIVDLAIAVGLLAARPRWPWLLARAAANPPTAAYLAALGRRHRATRLYPVAAFIAAVTAADLHACLVLRASDR
ncbi:hypothetical protein [Actinomycetospora sp.]|jgi:hypothetical protein|uniref:hypothetical protein n=1 Tax=Actinomycetospora sp. TaxID=1872135 RepID=UPI002F41816D